MRTENTPQKPAMSIARTKPRRKFTASDVDSICRNCARGLTESESVRLLGKEPSAWFSFKSRASRTQAFADKLEQFQGQRIDQLLQQIEDAGIGKNRREPDWRASLAALKIMSMKRFGDHGADESQPARTPVHVTVALAAGMAMYQKLAAAKPAIDAPAQPKALPAPSGKLPPMFNDDSSPQQGAD